MLPLANILTPTLLILATTSLTAISQTQIDLNAFDETAVPADLTIQKRKVAEGIEHKGIDSAGRVHFEMTVDESGNLVKGTTALKYVYDANGNHISMLLDENGEIIPRVKGALYCFIVPGPNGHFLRKAWLDKDGTVLEEERRAYDAQGRLVVEGYVDPASGSYTEEYRHRYSEDGKIQFTTEFLKGVQIGPEAQRKL